jgi:hypothetical protein
MKLSGPLVRILAVAGLCTAGTFAAVAPAFAGPAEVALLESYSGSWKGRGVLAGAEKETVVCRMSVTPGNGDKMNYSGRCALAGNTVSVKGTIAYIDAKRRYEAAMTTNAGFTGLAVGQKSGDGIHFSLQDNAADENGNAVRINAAIDLQGPTIVVQFNATFVKTGETLAATVPFTK